MGISEADLTPDWAIFELFFLWLDASKTLASFLFAQNGFETISLSQLIGHFAQAVLQNGSRAMLEYEMPRPATGPRTAKIEYDTRLYLYKNTAEDYGSCGSSRHRVG